MAPTAAHLVNYLRRLANPSALDTAPDAVLLERFSSERDEAAFGQLVGRHGPLVLGVCRRVLGDAHAAEDAFQATFLVLARQAKAVRRPGALAAWVHAVAYRMALQARAAIKRRRVCESPAPDLAPPDPHPDPLEELTARELVTVIDEEVQRLPEVYRLPLILCCLEGLTQEEVARRLGWTPGSVKGRLERGRQRLHARLAKRGLMLAAALAAVELARGMAAACVPAPLLMSTTKAATLFAAGQAAAGGAISAQVATLTAGALKAMLLTKLRVIAVLILGLAVVGGSVALLTWWGWPDAARATPLPAVKPRNSAASHLPSESRHQFGPVNRNWISKVAYLVPDKDNGSDPPNSISDPPNSWVVVEPKDRDARCKEYYKEVRYFANKTATTPRKILMYYPDGSLYRDIEKRAGEQFTLYFYPNGGVHHYTHWRQFRWLGGYSVSPDGRTIHRLARGKGELVFYGRKPGNYEHSWYDKGKPFLSKRCQNHTPVQVRLNGRQDDWLIITKTEESLQLRKESWHRREDGELVRQMMDRPIQDNERNPRGMRAKRAKQYLSRRAVFLEQFEKILKRAGYSWDRLGIDFVRTRAAWPY